MVELQRLNLKQDQVGLRNLGSLLFCVPALLAVGSVKAALWGLAFSLLDESHFHARVRTKPTAESNRQCAVISGPSPCCKVLPSCAFCALQFIYRSG